MKETGTVKWFNASKGFDSSHVRMVRMYLSIPAIESTAIEAWMKGRPCFVVVKNGPKGPSRASSPSLDPLLQVVFVSRLYCSRSVNRTCAAVCLPAFLKIP